MLRIGSAEDLGAAAVIAVAQGRRIFLEPDLLASVGVRRDEVLRLLQAGGPVYGVNTGMGAASEVRLDGPAQSRHQNNLMLARAVGSAPWLGVPEARAVLTVRLQTFLGGDAGVSPALCARLVELLNAGVHPAIPSTRIGAAGEIIPLAHLGGALAGSGEFLSGPAADSATVPAVDALLAAGIAPYSFGPKEGVALIEGVPVTTALALLRIDEGRLLADQAVALTSAELCLIGASRDPFTSALARGDVELGRVLGAIRRLSGPEPAPRALQSPLSFRVLGTAVAQLLRSLDAADAAVGRALHGVTDSPAYLEGRFVGTAGFDGFDLAAALDSLRVSIIHAAETSAARIHRLLDGNLTGLSRQLSGQPGLHAGMVAVHKRAVGVVHALVAGGRPSAIGAIETSSGQEDIQSFSVEAADSCGRAVAGLRDVLACELLTVIQGIRLAADTAAGLSLPDELDALLSGASNLLPEGTSDRPFGRDIAALERLLASGWGRGTLSQAP